MVFKVLRELKCDWILFNLWCLKNVSGSLRRWLNRFDCYCILMSVFIISEDYVCSIFIVVLSNIKNIRLVEISVSSFLFFVGIV